MRGRGPSGPTASTWADALLTTDAEALLGAVRNYLGPVKTPYDKRDLVKRLESFLRRPDTAESLILLLDRLDARIIGSCLLLGPSSETAVKELFAGELALFELGVRLSNLLDRLLLFRYVADGKRLIAVNPLLEASLRLTVLDPLLLFGASDRPALGVPERQAACDAPTCVAFFSFLFHTPGALRKGGGLTKRATERVLPLFAGMGAGTAERAAALARALYASGAIRHEESEWAADRNAFGSMLAQWGPDLPFFLAAALSDLDSHGEDEEREGSLAAAGTGARGRIEGLARLLAEALGSPHVADMSRAGLSRWLRICSRRADHQGDPSLAMPALEALGLLGLAVAAKARPMAEAGPPAASEPSASEPRLPEAAGSAEPRVRLVAEGAHALHLMPEASLEDRLLVGCIARPLSLGRVWSFDLERDTARRAFASGLDAATLEARLGLLAGRSLPQSLAFSLKAWEEEYRSLRLYRGLFLVADERMRPVIERGAALGSLVAELVAPGVYFLATASPEEVGAVLGRSGLEAPPPVAPPIPSFPQALESEAGSGEGAAQGRREGSSGILAELSRMAGFSADGESGAGRGSAVLDPGPRLEELRAALDRLAGERSPESRRELADRIERRLVLSERQIAESDPRPERLEATGLDYMGKVRVVERALRSRGDRLEVLYRLPGEEPVRALLRPVKLEKNDKGLVLEAEDLATGGPARVPLGAVSTVRRVRASLFGDEA